MILYFVFQAFMLLIQLEIKMIFQFISEDDKDDTLDEIDECIKVLKKYQIDVAKWPQPDESNLVDKCELLKQCTLIMNDHLIGRTYDEDLCKEIHTFLSSLLALIRYTYDIEIDITSNQSTLFAVNNTLLYGIRMVTISGASITVNLEFKTTG